MSALDAFDRRRALALLASAAIPGCVPGFVVVQQAPRNPFAGQRVFRLHRLELANMVYFERPGSPPPEPRDVLSPLDRLFDSFNSEFRRGIEGTIHEGIVSDSAGDEAFSIRPRAIRVDPGFVEHESGRTVLHSSNVQIRVRFTAPGDIFDEIEVFSSTLAAFVYALPTGRLGHDGLQCGRAAAEHLRRRIGA